MAPQSLGTIFPQDFLNAAFRVSSQEARDPSRGAKPGTLTSILNRYFHPGYGSDWRSWLLNPNQYAVLKHPSKETGAAARQFYNSPEGLNLLQSTAQQLRGATDFRSTSSLQDQGLLMKYSDNMIPVNVGGNVQYLSPGELQKRKLAPYLGENTFFSESGPTKTPWWQRLGGRSEAPVEDQTGAVAADYPLAGKNLGLLAMMQQFAPGTSTGGIGIPRPISPLENMFNKFGPLQ